MSLVLSIKKNEAYKTDLGLPIVKYYTDHRRATQNMQCTRVVTSVTVRQAQLQVGSSVVILLTYVDLTYVVTEFQIALSFFFVSLVCVV